MSWLRYITVESLCIAAEVTAALLLLAFSIPDKRKNVVANPNEELRKKQLQDIARQAHLDQRVTLGLYWIESDAPTASLPPRSVDEELSTIELLGWLDRLSGGLNRSFLDEFLGRWLALPSELRVGSHLTMFVVDQYSELVRAKGPIEVEKALRELGSRLRVEFGQKSIVGRYPPDRFLVIGFGRDMAKAHEQALEIHQCLQQDTNAEASNVLSSLKLIASIVELSDEWSDTETLVNNMEDAVLEAAEAGETCVTRQGAHWSSEPPPKSANLSLRRGGETIDSSTETPRTSDQLNSSGQSDLTSVVENSVAPSEVIHSEVDDNQTAGSANSDSDSPQSRSTSPAAGSDKKTDVSAVASTEEIESLLSQLKQSNKNKPSESKPADATPQPTATPIEQAEENSVVSSDDIASLFLQVKSEQSGATNPDVASKPVPAIPLATVASSVAPTQPPAAPEAPIAELGIELGEAATADDIASFFEAVKREASAPTSSNTSNASAEPSTVLESSPSANKKADSESEIATQDDIAEILRTVQNAANPIQAETPVAKQPESPAKEIDLTESASADDIEELLRSMRK